MKPVRQTKAQTDAIKREGILATHIRACTGILNPITLSQSYALPVERVRQIIARNGGKIG